MDTMKEITADDVRHMLKERPEEAHKGDFGKVLVAAGSAGMAGAAVLCGKAAYKAGAGIVSFYVPKELFPVMQISLPEATCIDRGTGTDLSGYEAVALGPGLGTGKENAGLVRKMLTEYEGTLVIDADGLNTIAREDLYGEFRNSEADIIITPHPGEAKRLLNTEKIKCRQETAETMAGTFGTTSVLKGAGTVIAFQDGKTYINRTGNPGMATGGSGDVLTGIIASLAAQGLDPGESAAAGVFIHGMAGDAAADELGQTGMTAMDICDHVADAFKELKGK